MPFPVKLTVDGLPAALCVMDREADFNPGDEGENVTVITYGVPGGNMLGAGPTEKCAPSAPVTITDPIVSGRLPEFPIVNVKDLLWPT